MDIDPSNPVKVQDECAGPLSPDIELVGAPAAFRDHGFVTGPPGEDVFTIVRISYPD